ncbi:MAG: hypothetical protein DRP62_05220 [Planctomycetota bacterium]|nr:MAG: hypothetical protein DRP62_05220 [Planctomycetota bacterium]
MSQKPFDGYLIVLTAGVIKWLDDNSYYTSPANIHALAYLFLEYTRGGLDFTPFHYYVRSEIIQHIISVKLYEGGYLYKECWYNNGFERCFYKLISLSPTSEAGEKIYSMVKEIDDFCKKFDLDGYNMKHLAMVHYILKHEIELGWVKSSLGWDIDRKKIKELKPVVEKIIRQDKDIK